MYEYVLSGFNSRFYFCMYQDILKGAIKHIQHTFWVLIRINHFLSSISSVTCIFSFSLNNSANADMLGSKISKSRSIESSFSAKANRCLTETQLAYQQIFLSEVVTTMYCCVYLQSLRNISFSCQSISKTKAETKNIIATLILNS